MADYETTGEQYPYAIESVDNATRTLMMLVTSPTIRIVDVARELGVARSTAHRMVTTLVQSGFLRREEETRAYAPGEALLRLSQALARTMDIRKEVAPLLRRIMAATEETTHFLILDGDEVEFLAVAEGPHMIRAASRVGDRLPARVTASGKVLLALLPEHRLAELYPDDQAALQRELGKVRQAGWAMNNAESEPDLVSIGAVLHDGRGLPLGAISVSGPASRLSPRTTEIAGIIRELVGEAEKGAELPPRV